MNRFSTAIQRTKKTDSCSLDWNIHFEKVIVEKKVGAGTRTLTNIDARTVRRILFYDLDRSARIAALKTDLAEQNKLDRLAWVTTNMRNQEGHGIKSSSAARYVSKHRAEVGACVLSNILKV